MIALKIKMIGATAADEAAARPAAIPARAAGTAIVQQENKVDDDVGFCRLNSG